MKVLRKVFMVGVLLISANISFAAPSGWSQWSTITNLVVTSGGGINVKLDPLLQECVSASGYGPHYASIYPSHPGIDRMHAQILSAAMSGKKVQFYFDNTVCKVVEIRIEI